jgi:hypothetical protein
MIKKGLILREDCYLYDGRSKTATRQDSSGGYASGLRIGEDVDVLTVYGNGQNRTIESIKNAVRAIGTTAPRRRLCYYLMAIG